MLEKQTITIPLGLGVNTKTDEKLVEQGAFNLVCENATFEKIGAVKKRRPYQVIAETWYKPDNTVGTSTGTIADLASKPTCAAVVGDSVFLRNPLGEYLYTHNDDLVYKPDFPIPECKVSSFAVYSAKTSVDATDLDYEPTEGMIVAAVRDGSSTIATARSRLILFDYEKKTTVTPESSGTTTSGSYYFGYCRASWTRVSGVSYYYHIYVTPDKTLNIYTYNRYGQPYGAPVQVSNVPGDYTVMQDMGTIAVCRSTDNTKLFIIVPTTTTDTDRFICLSGTTVVTNTTFTRTASSASTGWYSGTAKYDGSSIRFSKLLSNDNVYETILNESGVVTTTEALTFSLTNGWSIAYSQESTNLTFSEGAAGSELSGRYYTNFAIKDSEIYNAFYFTDSLSAQGIIQSACTSITETGFNSYFIIPPEVTGHAGTKAFARVSQGSAKTSPRQVSRCAKINDNIYAALLPVAAGSDGITDKSNAVLYFFELNQDYKSNSRSVIGKSLHLSGGFLAEFDGETLTENGFHLRCPPPVLTPTGTGLTGTYSYKTVLKYTDKNGQVTRSEPSTAVSTGAITNKSLQITMKAMPFGVKALNCQVEIYRTVNNGSAYYLVQVVDANMIGSNSAWSATVTDSAADNTIADNMLLYTTGDVLAFNPGPACKYVAQGGNRLALFGLEDENEIAFSQKKLLGECVNFSDFNRIRIDTSQYNITGGCIAGAYMDGKWIVGKKNSLFYFAGDGPNDLGLNDTFTVPELISSDTGISDPRSVVMTPRGMMFKGVKGIYLLDRSLGTSYIGSSVEEFNDFNITSATHIDSDNRVVFTVVSDDTSEKYQLSYDYFTEQWSVFNGVRAIDGDVLAGEQIILNSADNVPLIQEAGTFQDDGTAYSVRVKTPWIKVSGIQDFGRIWSVEILGKYKSAHNLNVKIYYDYDNSYYEEKTIEPLVSDSQYQYRIHLKKQKCEAVQFEIQDLDQSGTGESMELTALTLEVGLRKGSFKLPASRKY